LNSSTSDKSLHKNNGSSLLILLDLVSHSFLEVLIFSDVCPLEVSVHRRVGTHLDLIDQGLFHHLLLLLVLLLQSSIDGGLGFFELGHVADLASAQIVIEFKFELLNADFGLEDLAWEGPVEFLNALVRR